MITEKQIDEAANAYVEKIIAIVKFKLKSRGIEPTDAVLDELVVITDPFGIDHIFYNGDRIVSFKPMVVINNKVTREHF